MTADRLDDGAPSPEECRGPGDVGKIHHDVAADVWYECVFDRRRDCSTWTILPPADPPRTSS